MKITNTSQAISIGMNESHFVQKDINQNDVNYKLY